LPNGQILTILDLNSSQPDRGVTRGEQFLGRRMTAGDEKSQKCHITSTFFNTVHMLPKNFRSEHGGAKLASWHMRDLTSLCLCRFRLISTCL